MTKDQINIISKAMDQPEALTEWEYDFINILADYDEDRNLSVAQERSLERIGNKLED
jgi:hypothetical protein